MARKVGQEVASYFNNTFEPKAKSIGEMLGRYERRPANIPAFQREYRWEKAQINDFFNDIKHFYIDVFKKSKSSVYFLGPIVVREGQEEITVLDGQQRLATSVITLATIRDSLIELSKDTACPEIAKDYIKEIQDTLIEKGPTPAQSEPVFSLILGEIDKIFFRDNIQKINSANHLKKRAGIKSHELIRSAYRLIRELMKKEIDQLDGIQKKVDYLKGFSDALAGGAKVVSIIVQNEHSAYKIFETLNDRGLRLSVSDLLLNHLMSLVKRAQTRAVIREKWNHIIEVMGNKDMTRFFRHSWISRYGDVKSQSLYHELTDKLKSSSEGVENFVDDCLKDVEFYQTVLDGGLEYTEKEIKLYSDGIIKNYKTTPAIPLILSSRRILNDNWHLRVLKLLNSFVFRYSIIMNFNPNDLETVLYDLAKTTYEMGQAKNSSNQIYRYIKSVLKSKLPEDDDVLVKLLDHDFDNSEALWTLIQLELNANQDCSSIDFVNLSVEHVYPQNPDVKAWKDNAALSDRTMKIGNLTLLGKRENSAVGNAAYAVKRTYYNRSGLALNASFRRLTNWDSAKVDIRTAKLSGTLIGVTKI